VSRIVVHSARSDQVTLYVILVLLFIVGLFGYVKVRSKRVSR
jgi:hypothetical protein